MYQRIDIRHRFVEEGDTERDGEFTTNWDGEMNNIHHMDGRDAMRGMYPTAT